MSSCLRLKGTVTPVNVIKAGPCIVVQKKVGWRNRWLRAVSLVWLKTSAQVEARDDAMRGTTSKDGRRYRCNANLKELRSRSFGLNVGDKCWLISSRWRSHEVVGRSDGARKICGTIKRHNFNSA